MTQMDFLEATSLTLGEELGEFSGFRSTRLTGQLEPETRLVTGLDDASSGDGITITFPVLSIPITVVAGQLFRLLSGTTVIREALIVSRTSDQQIVLQGAGIGAGFTSLSWEILEHADTTAPVESTLGWATQGEVIIDGVRYRYGATTLSSLLELCPTDYLPGPTAITTIAGLLIADGETLEIDFGGRVVLEFDKDDIWDRENEQVRITNASTADEVRDAIVAALLRVRKLLEYVPSASAAATVLLTPNTVGGIGQIHVVDRVFNVGFVAPGPRGVDQLHLPLGEVVDFSLVYSAIDTYRRSFSVEHAIGEDLSTIGRNLGKHLLRQPELLDDEIYRRFIMNVGYARLGTLFALELALDALVGPGNYELFEDLTLGSINHPHRVYVRRSNRAQELRSIGKTFLEGPVDRPITSATAIGLTETPIRVIGVRLADENKLRLIDSGTATVISLAGTRATASGPLSTRIRIGDIFEITAGPFSGQRATISDPSAAPVLDFGPVAGSPFFALAGVPDSSTANLPFRVIRPISNFRHYRPTEETYLEAGIARAIWTYTGSTPANENANVTLQFLAADGAFLRIIVPAAPETVLYRHRTRIQPASRATVEMHFSVPATATVDAGATLFNQWACVMRDGARALAWGLIRVAPGTDLQIAPINLTTGAIIAGAGSFQIPVDTYMTVTIVKDGTGTVRFLHDGEQFAEVPHASFPASALTELEWGGFSVGAGAMRAHVKTVDWSSETDTDYWNARAANGVTPGAGSRNITSVSTPFVVLTDPGKQVRISDFTVSNAGGGNPIGQWTIESVASTSQATLIGPRHERATFDPSFPTRITVRGVHDAFKWPHNRGHGIDILTGPNAGSYTIARLLDPGDLTQIEQPRLAANEASVEVLSNDVRDNGIITVFGLEAGVLVTETVTLNERFPVAIPQVWDLDSIIAIVHTLNIGYPNAVPFGRITLRNVANQATVMVLGAGEGSYGRDGLARAHSGLTSSAGIIEIPTNVLEITTPLPAPTDDSEQSWRLRPVFANDAGPIPFEVVDAGTIAGTTLTLRQNFPIAIAGAYIPLVEVLYTRVLSAQVLDRTDDNVLVTPPATYAFAPFYLQDDWGFIRRMLKPLVKAGVFVDFDNLIRDASGLHILD